MLSKIVRSMMIIGFLAVPLAADAHPRNKAAKTGVTVSSGPVTVSWSWVAGHRTPSGWVRGHWVHPRYGKSFRPQRHVHHRNSHAHAHRVWVPGHYRSSPHGRVWVSGHWVRR